MYKIGTGYTFVQKYTAWISECERPSMLRIHRRQYMVNNHGNTDSKEGEDTQYDHSPLVVCEGLTILQAAEDRKHFGGCRLS